MSAQYLVSFNGTDHHLEILTDGHEVAGGGNEDDDPVSQTKQKEALYYIVAVITFYVFTFMLLFCKYARFRKKELDDSIPYFSLPPDAKMAGSSAGGRREVEGDLMALRKYGPRDPPVSYGSSDVTPVTPVTPRAKVMRVKMMPHWLCRRDDTTACDV